MARERSPSRPACATRSETANPSEEPRAASARGTGQSVRSASPPVPSTPATTPPACHHRAAAADRQQRRRVRCVSRIRRPQNMADGDRATRGACRRHRTAGVSRLVGGRDPAGEGPLLVGAEGRRCAMEPEDPDQARRVRLACAVQGVSVGKGAGSRSVTAGVLTCDMIASLDKWVKRDVQPQARDAARRRRS